MAKYKVIEEVEILGEIRTIGLEIEIDEETAAPFINDGSLELVPEEPTLSAPLSDESSTAGESTTPPPPTGEKPKDWVGGHNV